MSNHTGTGRLDEQQDSLGVGRRNFLRLTGGVAAGVMSAIDAPVLATQTLAWDKTFPRSERVDHRKVTFYNRLGIALVADLYAPKAIDRTQRHPSLVVGGPYGAVKEQASGLYAQAMAERGYITIAHIRPTSAKAAVSLTASPQRKRSSRTSAPGSTIWAGYPSWTARGLV